MIHINAIAHAEISMFEDRGVKKVRVNVFRDGKIRGFLRPLSSFHGGFWAGNREDSNI